jgi:hypothetical protein
MGLLAASAGFSAKVIHSKRVPTREELEILTRHAQEKIEGYFPERAPQDGLVGEKASSSRESSQSGPTDPIPGPPSGYEQFLAKFAFRYIRPYEIIRPHQRVRNGIANQLPPTRLWPNLPATLRVADEIRHRLGRPLTYITSAYRSPSYNRQCGGASRSYHMRNNALDLVYATGPEAAFDIAQELRREGFFQGGVGVYNNFIHIDTRGYNATWTG